MNGGADIRPVEYLADLYLHSGRNIARVTGPGRLLSFYGGHAIVRDLRDVLWALLQPDLVIHPTARYWEFMPHWIRMLQDPKQGGREANAVVAAIALPDGWHVGLPPDYALYHERDTVPVPYGWAPDPPPPPSSPEARCANPGCDKLLSPKQLKAGLRACSVGCATELKQSRPAPAPLPPQACAWCGEPFTPKWQRPKAGKEPCLTRYCGRPCAGKASAVRERQARDVVAPTPCAHCGGLFKPYRSQGGYTRYCSRKCANAESTPKMLAALAAKRGAAP
jgi:hypothetical protein